MRGTLVIAFGFLMFWGHQALNAQLASTDVSTVLNSSLAAQVGKAPVESAILRGSVEAIAGSDDETVPFDFEAVASGSSRTEIDLGAGKITETRQAVASGSTGAWSKGSSGPHSIAGHNLMTDAAWWFPIFIEQRLLSDPNVIVSFVGLESGVAHFQAMHAAPSSVPDAAAGLVRHLSQVDLYLDFSTLLPAKIVFNVHPDDNAQIDIPVTVQFSNYQAVNGVVLPMHIQRYVNNTLSLDARIQSAAFNSGIAQTDFQIQ